MQQLGVVRSIQRVKLGIHKDVALIRVEACQDGLHSSWLLEQLPWVIWEVRGTCQFRVRLSLVVCVATASLRSAVIAAHALSSALSPSLPLPLV